jgi:Fe-S cluster assembly iron-binding protein IscA
MITVTTTAEQKLKEMLAESETDSMVRLFVGGFG